MAQYEDRLVFCRCYVNSLLQFTWVETYRTSRFMGRFALIRIRSARNQTALVRCNQTE